MNLKPKKTLVRAFSLVAAAGLVVGSVSCTAPDHVHHGNPSVGNVNSSKASIKARDVVACLMGKKDKAFLNRDQRRIVDLTARAWVLPLGKQMLEKAAQKNITFGINNNAKGYAHYHPGNRAIEFKESTIKGKHALRILYHELTHFYQYDVWKRGVAPLGTCSFDKKIWNLSNEAHADLLADIAMDQHAQLKGGRSITTAGTVARYRFFVNDILSDSKFHRNYYGFKNTSLRDGKRVNVRAYCNAFGVLPEISGNFLSGRFQSTDDIYKAVVFPDKKLRAYYQKAGGAVNVTPRSP